GCPAWVSLRGYCCRSETTRRRGRMAQPEQRVAAGAAQETDPRVFAALDAIDATTTGPLRQRLLAHLDAHGPYIWIDLEGVDFIDSTGLGLLIGVLREARDRGGHVGLLRPTRQVRRVLQITGLEPPYRVEP